MTFYELIQSGVIRHIDCLMETGREDEALALIEEWVSQHPELVDAFREHFKE